ncbi:hypothetical protein O4J56_05245 [Nocardiopsis sp. RSe5-2]|uniref:Uncharacterized protein n=1 Tax=Nocardiopsis endophytica TaxID=3018445 RepID=A0ABT4U032_9ACTN|nr:hypothetical protein [Nocardiopsis endophytica]MDA2810036.1 hypothetical protein [Nocardiopsis endophytica]
MAAQWQQENGRKAQEAAERDAEFEGDFETSEADLAEQRAEVGEEETWSADRPLGVSDDVPEGDAVEQHLEVGGDDDEYRE